MSEYQEGPFCLVHANDDGILDLVGVASWDGDRGTHITVIDGSSGQPVTKGARADPGRALCISSEVFALEVHDHRGSRLLVFEASDLSASREHTYDRKAKKLARGDDCFSVKVDDGEYLHISATGRALDSCQADAWRPIDWHPSAPDTDRPHSRVVIRESPSGARSFIVLPESGGTELFEVHSREGAWTEDFRRMDESTARIRESLEVRGERDYSLLLPIGGKRPVAILTQELLVVAGRDPQRSWHERIIMGIERRSGRVRFAHRIRGNHGVNSLSLSSNGRYIFVQDEGKRCGFDIGTGDPELTSGFWQCEIADLEVGPTRAL